MNRSTPTDVADAAATPVVAPSAERITTSLWEVIRVALPLMISTGTFSLVLFADRTFLLWYDGAAMSAAMAAGNLFWSLVCLPVGMASMTGAIVSQYVGSNNRRQIGRFLWQSVWFAAATVPIFAIAAYFAPAMFAITGQPAELRVMETTYLRWLMIGAAGVVLESGLSGFFSGTERTRVIMWASIATGGLNLILDYALIFGVPLGVWTIPSLGIAGAGIASAISFWFKAILFAVLLWRPGFEGVYRFRAGFGWDGPLMAKLLYFGTPAGLMYLTESGGFTTIVLRIGRLGDLPLRATSMAINFNMIAFIPLMGVSIAASVLVGRHLLESSAARAAQSVLAALSIGWLYSLLWAVAYIAFADQLMSLYRLSEPTAESAEALDIAAGLLTFVALYVIADATQLILAGALRGAGDTWFVLLAGFSVSAGVCCLGIVLEPQQGGLRWWWWVVTAWVWLLAAAMTLRYLSGRWKKMRMV